MHDLTGFQRDVLKALADMDGDDPKGVTVKAWLETDGGYTKVLHGRLYPNLDMLANMGLVDKGEKDRRTNEYELTPRGKREVTNHVQAWTDAVADLTDADRDTGLDALFTEGEA